MGYSAGLQVQEDVSIVDWGLPGGKVGFGPRPRHAVAWLGWPGSWLAQRQGSLPTLPSRHHLMCYRDTKKLLPLLFCLCSCPAGG